MKLSQIIAGTGFEGLGKSVANAVAKHAEMKQEKYAEKLVVVLDKSDSFLNSAVSTLRHYKKMMEQQKRKVKKISRAIDYLKETGNPLPYYKATSNTHLACEFCHEIGADVPDSDDKLWLIPKDWNPSEEN